MSILRRWFPRFVRAGYVTKAATYFALGLLAIAAAVGIVRASAAEPGTMQALFRQPFGATGVVLVAAGMAFFGTWRLAQALLDPEGRGWRGKSAWVRAGYLISSAVHLGVAAGATDLLFDAQRRHESGAKRSTAWLMSQPLGRWLVGAVGVGICTFAVIQLVRAVRSDVKKQLDVADLPEGVCRGVTCAARVGIAARGVVFGLLGALLIGAALEVRPDKARGMAEMLRFVEMQPFGPLLLGLLALGLLAFGAYMGIQARYRIIPTPEIDGTSVRRRLEAALPGRA